MPSKPVKTKDNVEEPDIILAARARAVRNVELIYPKLLALARSPVFDLAERLAEASAAAKMVAANNSIGVLSRFLREPPRFTEFARAIECHNQMIAGMQNVSLRISEISKLTQGLSTSVDITLAGSALMVERQLSERLGAVFNSLSSSYSHFSDIDTSRISGIPTASFAPLEYFNASHLLRTVSAHISDEEDEYLFQTIAEETIDVTMGTLSILDYRFAEMWKGATLAR